MCWSSFRVVWAQAARGGHGGIRAVGAFGGSSSPALCSTGNNFSSLTEERAAVTEGPSPPCVAESKHMSSSTREDTCSTELKKKNKPVIVLIFKIN